MARKTTHEEYVLKVRQVNENIIVLDKYNGNHTPIRHQCECGNDEWYAQPSNVLNNRTCKLCATKRVSEGQVKKHEDYVEELHIFNPNIFVLENYLGARIKIKHQCECGNKNWYASPSNVLKGRRCKICGTSRFIKAKTRTNEEFTNEVYNLVGNEYTPLEPYVLVTEYIKMRHNICGHEWDIIPISFLVGTRCPQCANERCESIIAITLKQVLKYYYPNTKWEYDIGFKGFNGGRSAYDIYVPELNLLIECQSEYHDDIEKQKLDLVKKNYAIKSGYEYMAIDKRNYTQLGAIRLFFPKVDSVPDWVDTSMRHIKSSWDVKKAQNLLNEGYTIPEIGEILQVSYSLLQSGVERKSLIKPDNYKIKQVKQRKNIIQLDLEGNFIKEFNGLTLIEGFTATNISACCRGKDKSYKGFRWMFAVDYYNNINDIKPYKEIVKQTPRPVVQLSNDNRLIAKYTNMSNIEGFNKSGIWNCCNNKKKTYKSYKWMYLEDYEQKYKEEKKEGMVGMNSLEGKTFVVTGKVTTFKNRDEVGELITSLGGVLSGSVSKNTSYLLNNDITSTTGKNKKALELGVEIISESQFNEMIGR